MKLIINIPAYNEEQAIAKTIKNIPRHYKGISDVKIQVVNDGSSDNTVAEAQKGGADIIVSHKTNRRLGATFNTAVESALVNGADIMVNIDADGQFDSGEIQKMLDPILNGKADMVIGDRFNKGSADGIPPIKRKLNRLGAHLVGRFLRVDIHDLTCGFRAHDREVLLRLNAVSGFTYTQETIIDAIGKNLKLVWVPVSVEYFKGRQSRIVSSVWGFVNKSVRIIIKTVRDVRPMKFFGVPGIILIALSIITFIVFLCLYFPEFQITPYRNYLLSAIVLFLVGMQLTVFALIADMIRSTRKVSEDLMYGYKKDKYTK